jgi:hypothetical protein
VLPQPHLRNPCRVSHANGLASSDFARHYSRNHFCFLFLWVLRCFTSPRSLHTPYFIQVQVTGHDSSWVSPFGHPRITARLPTPQGLSQAPTSFIGSRCQGIHHVPFKACHTNTQQKQQRHTLHKQSPQQDTHHHPDPKARATRALIMGCSRPLSSNQTPRKHQPNQMNHSSFGLILQGPTVCQTTTRTPTTHVFHTTPERMAVLSRPSAPDETYRR